MVSATFKVSFLCQIPRFDFDLLSRLTTWIYYYCTFEWVDPTTIYSIPNWFLQIFRYFVIFSFTSVPPCFVCEINPYINFCRIFSKTNKATASVKVRTMNLAFIYIFVFLCAPSKTKFNNKDDSSTPCHTHLQIFSSVMCSYYTIKSTE